MSVLPFFVVALLALLAFGILAGIGVLIANPKTRPAGLAIPGSLALLLFGGWFMGQSKVTQVRQSSGPVATAAAPVSPAPANAPINNPPIDNPPINNAPITYVRSERQVSWGVFLLPVTLLVALSAAATACFRNGQHYGGWAVAGFAVLIVLVFGLRLWQSERSASQPAAIAVASAPPATMATDEAFDKLTEPRINLDPSETIEPPTPSKPKPDWVTDRPSQADGVYRRVLKSGPFNFDDEGNQDQRMQVLNAALEYLQQNAGSKVGRIPGDVRIRNAKQLGVSYSDLIRNIVTKEHLYQQPNSGAVQGKKFLYTLVEINQRTGEWLIARWQYHGQRGGNQEENVIVLAILSGLVLTVIAGVYGLLRIDTATNGRYTKRLLIGAPVGIMISLGLFVFVMELLD